MGSGPTHLVGRLVRLLAPNRGCVAVLALARVVVHYLVLAVAIVGMSTLACLRAILDASIGAAARGSRPGGGAPSVQAPATPAAPGRRQLDNYQSRISSCSVDPHDGRVNSGAGPRRVRPP